MASGCQRRHQMPKQQEAMPVEERREMRPLRPTQRWQTTTRQGRCKPDNRDHHDRPATVARQRFHSQARPCRAHGSRLETRARRKAPARRCAMVRPSKRRRAPAEQALPRSAAKSSDVHVPFSDLAANQAFAQARPKVHRTRGRTTATPASTSTRNARPGRSPRPSRAAARIRPWPIAPRDLRSARTAGHPTAQAH